VARFRVDRATGQKKLLKGEIGRSEAKERKVSGLSLQTYARKKRESGSKIARLQSYKGSGMLQVCTS